MSSPFNLEKRIALVTGASSGLGRHFAATLAQAGAKVAVCARRLDKTQELVEQLREAGHEALAVAMDVSSAASVREAFSQIEQNLGTIDLIVNNAGVAATQSVLEHDEATWNQVLDTNLKGAFLVAQEGARRLVQNGKGGSIVNIASILGERVAGGAPSYAASKAGLIQLTKAMALELARHGIRVNALAPGYVSTDLNRDFLASDAGQRLMARIPQRRFASPEELDGPLLLLASDAGSYITGAVLAVDGGHLVSSL
ncbi:SDR family NAD(P)-dependent oxidoreductase [Stutzerimonas stutzeri]|uniref:SDR family NAD(P)-dependent oxidoreductase n=1 Tax=Stutzerimonas stutzeri TaxID=316 RepID=UPI002447BB9A|nr:glucose 1-dehydrogenase [Stutzerimonas stutzeri]MDH0425404.1 glucose 1-dehydrogenase [Stutzerimonas stutzeri]